MLQAKSLPPSLTPPPLKMYNFVNNFCISQPDIRGNGHQRESFAVNCHLCFTATLL